MEILWNIEILLFSKGQKKKTIICQGNQRDALPSLVSFRPFFLLVYLPSFLPACFLLLSILPSFLPLVSWFTIMNCLILQTFCLNPCAPTPPTGTTAFHRHAGHVVLSLRLVVYQWLQCLGILCDKMDIPPSLLNIGAWIFWILPGALPNIKPIDGIEIIYIDDHRRGHTKCKPPKQKKMINWSPQEDRNKLHIFF